MNTPYFSTVAVLSSWVCLISQWLEQYLPSHGEASWTWYQLDVTWKQVEIYCLHETVMRTKEAFVWWVSKTQTQYQTFQFSARERSFTKKTLVLKKTKTKKAPNNSIILENKIVNILININ